LRLEDVDGARIRRLGVLVGEKLPEHGPVLVAHGLLDRDRLL